MTSRRVLVALIAATVVLLPSAAAAATTATSSADAEQALVELVNQRRAEVGLPALTPRADLHAAARGWSFTMAEQGRMSHSTDLGSTVCCWTRVAENVARHDGLGSTGAGRVSQQLYELWRGSPQHDRAMVDPDVDQLGLGVVVDGDGTAWGTTVFRACDGSSCDGEAQGPAGDTTADWAPPPSTAPPPSPTPPPEADTAPSPEPAPQPAPEPEPTTGPLPGPTPPPSPTPAPSPSRIPAPVPSPSPGPSPAASRSPAEPAPLVAAASAGPPGSSTDATGGLVVLVGTVLALTAAVVARRAGD